MDSTYLILEQGAYAEYVAAYADHCILKPKELTWVKAAGIMENWITCTSTAMTLFGSMLTPA